MQEGSLSLRLGLGWAKSQFYYTGQCPVLKYHRKLMMAILQEKVQVRKQSVRLNIPFIFHEKERDGLYVEC